MAQSARPCLPGPASLLGHWEKLALLVRSLWASMWNRSEGHSGKNGPGEGIHRPYPWFNVAPNLLAKSAQLYNYDLKHLILIDIQRLSYSQEGCVCRWSQWFSEEHESRIAYFWNQPISRCFSPSKSGWMRPNNSSGFLSPCSRPFLSSLSAFTLCEWAHLLRGGMDTKDWKCSGHCTLWKTTYFLMDYYNNYIFQICCR